MNVAQLMREALDFGGASRNPDDRADRLLLEVSRRFGIPLGRLHEELPQELVGRDPGFHASRSGACYRQVLTEVLNRGFLPAEVDYEQNRVFTIGHLIHDFVHNVLSKWLAVEGGTVLHIAPMRLTSFVDESCGFRVVGLPDEVLLDLETMTFHIIDLKTANERSFAWKVKTFEMYGTGYSNGNKLQVGTYGAALMKIIDTTALGRVFAVLRYLMDRAGSDLPIEPEYMIPIDISLQGHLCYIEKNVLESHTPIVGDHGLIGEAYTYWAAGVKPLWILAQATGKMPPSRPNEGWQCGYCSLFPITDVKTTEAKKKRALEKCRATTDETLLGMQPVEIGAQTSLFEESD